MPTVLHYGRSGTISLALEAANVSEVGLPELPVLQEVSHEIQRALRQPVEFPELALALVPDDRIVLALGPGLPCREQLVAGVLDYLLSHQVAASQISILQTAADAALLSDPRGQLPTDIREQIALVTHHPERRDELAYLAADAEGHPIYFHRQLIDADLILPIMLAQTKGNPAWGTSGLFPTFSDAQAQSGDSSSQPKASSMPSKKASKKSAEPSSGLRPETPDWLLGVQFGVRVVSGSANEIYAIHGGATEIVQRRSAEQLSSLWQTQVVGRHDLLILGIPSGEPISWERLAQVLQRWQPHVRKDGMLVICVELQGQLPPAVQHWATSGWRDEFVTAVVNEEVPGAEVVVQLAALRKQARLYLLSNLIPTAVEDLGLTPISRPQEIARLCQQSAGTLLVHYADRV